MGELDAGRLHVLAERFQLADIFEQRLLQAEALAGWAEPFLFEAATLDEGGFGGTQCLDQLRLEPLGDGHAPERRAHLSEQQVGGFAAALDGG